MQQIRFGIIGLGGMGSGHAKYLNSIEGAKLAAVCDADAARAREIASQHDVPHFANYQQLFDSKLIDAVIVATPHYFHPDISIAAFAAGLHVLCEKPVAVSVKEARRVNAAAAKYPHLKFGVMFQARTNLVWRKVREMVRTGEIGEISRISWTATHWFRTNVYYSLGGWRAKWKSEGGGVLLNQCPHTLDLLHWVPAMMPKKITAIASLGKRHPIEVEDEVSAILEYENGAIGTFITSTGEAPGTDRLEIAGENGKLVVEEGKISFRKLAKPVADYLNGPDRTAKLEVTDLTIDAGAYAESHRIITQNYVNAILKNEPLIAPGEDGAAGLEIGNAMLMAGVSRKPVELPLDENAYESFLDELKLMSNDQMKI